MSYSVMFICNITCYYTQSHVTVIIVTEPTCAISNLYGRVDAATGTTLTVSFLKGARCSTDHR